MWAVAFTLSTLLFQQSVSLPDERSVLGPPQFQRVS